MIWQDGKGKSHSNCVVMATHKMDERTLKYFTYIKEEVAMSMDFIIMYDCSHQPLDHKALPAFNIFAFDSGTLNGFFHRNDRRLPNPLVALIELSKHATYEHFLLMENDLVFTGDWSHLARQINEEDMDYIHIASDILGGPNSHWPKGYIQGSPFKSLYFSWSQLFYVSRQYVRNLEAFVSENDSFYYEFLLPTMSYNKGYLIKQFENFGYHFQLSWGPAEVFEYKYQFERQHNTFYHPIKNLGIVDIPEIVKHV